MLVLANPNKKPKRAVFARMLAHLTLGVGISAAATLFAPAALGQSCDKCAGVSTASCGCELPSNKKSVSKPAPCVRKPSVGELILGHFEQVGDQIEARAKKTKKSATATCSCEAPQGPSCGCEACSHAEAPKSAPAPLPPIQSGLIRPSAEQAASLPLAAKGTLADKPSPSSLPLPGKLPVAKRQDLNSSAPAIENADPKVRRIPFEQRNPTSRSTNRIPAIETDAAASETSIPNMLKPIPSDVPPAWAPQALPPSGNSIEPIDSNLPDVLVDPFKDDVSTKTKNKSLVQLTSDRQFAAKSLPSGSSEPLLAEQVELRAIARPAKLTPGQKLSSSPAAASGSLQFEASVSAANEGSKVVSSSYLHAMPVPVVVRKELVPDTSKPEPQNGAPNVSRMRVPTKR